MALEPYACGLQCPRGWKRLPGENEARERVSPAKCDRTTGVTNFQRQACNRRDRFRIEVRR